MRWLGGGSPFRSGWGAGAVVAAAACGIVAWRAVLRHHHGGGRPAGGGLGGGGGGGGGGDNMWEGGLCWGGFFMSMSVCVLRNSLLFFLACWSGGLPVHPLVLPLPRWCHSVCGFLLGVRSANPEPVTCSTIANITVCCRRSQ